MVATVVNVLFWAGLAYSLFAAIGGVMFLRQQLYSYDSKKGRLFQFYRPKKHRLRGWISALPDILISAVSAPLTILPFVLRSLVVAWRNSIGSFEDYQVWVVEDQRKRWGGLYFAYLTAAAWGIALVLGIALLPWARGPLLVWLCAFWGACVIWLLAAYSSRLSFLRRVRLTPGHSLANSLILVLLFGFVFPLVTTAVVLTLTDQGMDYEGVRQSLLKIFTLRGLVWEGPKNTLATILESPMEFFYVVTGVFLYGAVLSKIPQVLSGPPTDEDLQQAAGTALVLGRSKMAEDLLRKMKSENLESSLFLMISLLTQGDLAGAKKLSRSKFTFVQEYVRTPEVAAIGPLVLMAGVWNLSVELQHAVREEFLAARPDEEELSFLYLSFLGSKWKIPREGFWEYAQERGFIAAQFLIALATKNGAFLQEILKTRSTNCSIHASVQMLSDVFLGKMILSHDESQQEAIVESLVSRMGLALEVTTTVPGFFLLYTAMQYADGLLPVADIERRQHLTELRRELLRQATLLPQGQRFATLLREDVQVMAEVAAP